MILKKHLWFWITLFICYPLFAQETSISPPDSLPFKIDESKKLSDARLAKKKEGWMLTGLPRASYDPIQGIGVGGRGQLYFNGTKEDPFFEYTPFRLRTDFSVNFTQNGKIAAGVKLDVPYFLNTKWRTRFRFDFADNPNKLYFGPGEQSLQGLSYRDPITGELYEDLHYDDYIRKIKTIRPGNAELGEDPDMIYTDRRYNWIHYRKYATDLLAERTLMDGKLRLITGVGITDLTYFHYDGKILDDALDSEGNVVSAISGQTKVTEDYLAGKHDPNSFWAENNISGYEGGFLSKLKLGLIFDTRDFEPDPSKGSLIEYSFGYSPSWLGSDFNYVRNQFQAQKFLPVLPNILPTETTLAGRVMFSSVQGSDIFFREIFDIWSAEQGRLGVFGGEDALRGYKKFRFGGLIYGFANLELRTKVTSFSVFKQDIALSAVPFIDAGRVWDNFQNFQLNNFKYSPGIGARIAWNQSTILRIDYAVSKEDSQLFLVVGHIF